LRDLLLGGVGSTLALTALYFSSVVLLLGLHPIAIMKRTIAWFGERKEARRQAAIDAADAAQRIEMERQRLDREQARVRARGHVADAVRARAARKYQE
jgi:hypothetical protein